MNLSTQGSVILRLVAVFVLALLVGSAWFVRVNYFTTAETAPLPVFNRPHAQPAPARPVTVVPVAVVPASLPPPAPARPVEQTVARPAVVTTPPAEVADAPEASRPAGLSEDDRHFLERAIQSAIQQEKVSRGVVPELVYPEVRDYAYMILTDQPAADAELQALAARKGVVVAAPEPVAFRKWAREDGVLDQHYIKLVVEDNEDVAALCEKATESRDPDVAGYARKTLPVIRHHLHASRELRKVAE